MESFGLILAPFTIFVHRETESLPAFGAPGLPPANNSETLTETTNVEEVASKGAHIIPKTVE